MNNVQIPVVSIIMPVYNVEKYVTEAIDSILSQTYTDFELIILDDCSTDNSVAEIKKFKDPRIVVHCNLKNIGLAENLNTGLRLAKGKYIARMDGDDISLPERLKVQVTYLENHPDIDLCSCALEMFGTDHQVWIRDTDPEQVKITMLFFSPVLHATSVWRKESFSKNNLYYNQDAFPAEDYDLWSRAVFLCKLVNISEVMYKYRIHGIQVTKTDDRAAEKSREIQLKYILKALPSLSVESANDFIANFIHNDGTDLNGLKDMKLLLWAFLNENSKNPFFNHQKLKKRLGHYYQNRVYEYLINNKCFSIHLLLNLRVMQIVKLIYNRL